MRKIFACDIDNTISDSYRSFLEYKAKGIKKITKEHLTELLGISNQPITGASEALQVLSKYYTIAYVSARKKIHGEVTIDWLIKYNFPMDCLYLVQQNDFKLQVLKQLKPVVFVDDMKYNYENFDPKWCTDFMDTLRAEGINYEIFDNNWKEITHKYIGLR